MILEEKKFASKVGCHYQTLRVYLCRIEFAHIDRITFKKNKSRLQTNIYKNVNQLDIVRLKKILKRRIV